MEAHLWRSSAALCFGGSIYHPKYWESGRPSGNSAKPNALAARGSRPTITASAKNVGGNLKSDRPPVITGYASVFNEVSLPSNRPHDLGRRLCVRPAAFILPSDRHRYAVRFLIEHDPERRICTSDDHHTRVWQDHHGLGFAIAAITPELELIAARVEAGELGGASWGMPEQTQGDWDGDLFRVTASFVGEISLVRWGRCPGSGCKVIR